MAIDTIKATAILDGAIGTADLADDAVTNAKIATGVSAAKLTGALPAIDGSSLTGVDPADGSITTAKLADDAVTAGKLNVGQIGGRRNIIINGSMAVAQRGTSVSGVSSSGYRAVDRYRHTVSIGTWTISQSTDAPDGFGYSMKMDCTTAEASPASTDALAFVQKIEGQDLQQLKKGTASAESVTLSFWVKCTKTGTAQVNLVDEDNTRMIGQQFTINATNTWEQKTLTFAGDTTGALGNDNNSSLRVEIWLDAGSSYKSGATPTSWEALSSTDYFAGCDLNLGDSTSNDIYITGVQLEVGSVATPFEHRSYGEELALCQRYYWRITQPSTDRYAIGSGMMYQTNDPRCFIENPVIMRTNPSVEVAGNIRFERAGTSTGDAGTLAFTAGGPYGFVLYSSSGADTTTAGHGTIFYTYDQNDYIGADAEL